jgi:predicted trehalose synthase
MKKNILSADVIQDSLLSEVKESVERLPVFAKRLKIEADLAKLDDMAATKKLEAGDIDNRLAALRDALADTDPERLAELSKARVLLIAEQAEATGFLSDLEARKIAINKEKVKIQHDISEQARAIVEKIQRRETEEITALVAAIEARLKVWQNTVTKVRGQYFPGIGFEMLIVLESIRFFAPLVKESCTMAPIR